MRSVPTVAPRGAERGHERPAQAPSNAAAHAHSPLQVAGNQQALRALGVSAKLTMSQPGDPEEQEADRVADAFVSGAPATLRTNGVGVHGRVMTASARKTSGGREGGAADATAAVQQGGDALPTPVRRELEGRMGHDLGAVRIHTDARAQDAARAIQARAYTAGSDIAFAAGEYRPTQPEGRRLLAHEIAHVVQNGAAGARRTSGGPIHRDGVPTAPATLDPAYAGATRPASAPEPQLREREETSPYLKREPRADRIPGRGWETLIDGDGDQSKELVVAFDAIETDQFGRPLRMKVDMKLVSAATVVSQEYDLRGVMWMDALVPRVWIVTDGLAPTHFSLFGPSSYHEFLLDPPRRDPSGPTYRGRLAIQSGLDPQGRAGQEKEFHFAPDTAPTYSVFRPGTVRKVGDIWALDASVGAYGDMFRLTFSAPPQPPSVWKVLGIEDPDAVGRVLMGVSPLVEASPFGGDRMDLRITGELKVQVLSNSGAALVLDLNGDGQPDISVYDRLTEEADTSGYIQVKDASKHRSHMIAVAGPAAAVSQPSAHVKIEKGRLVTYGGGSERDFPAASQAMMVETLPKQSELGTLTSQVAALQSQRQTLRKQAVEKRLISTELHEAWTRLGDDIVAIGLRLGSKQTIADLQFKGEADAQIFGRLFGIAAQSGTKYTMGYGGGVSTWSNPYTGEEHVSGMQSSDTAESLTQAFHAGRVRDVMNDYTKLANGLDRWIARRMRETEGEKSENAKKLESMVSLDEALYSISHHKPTRVDAVFHPDAQYRRYGHVYDVPLLLYYWRSGDTWHLKDVTNPDNTFEDTCDYTVGETEPPQELFDELDYKKHFLQGIIYYQIPGGRGGRVETTERMTWSDYVAWASTAIAAAAFIAVTAGAGTPVAVAGAYAFVASGVLGATSAVLDLVESAKHGHLDARTVVVDVAQIVAGLGGAAAITSGKITQAAVKAAEAGRPLAGGSALVAQWADRLFVPLVGATATADTIQLAVFTEDIAKQLDAIDQGLLDPADATRAKIILLGQLALFGGLTVLSLKGSLPSLTRGRNLEIAFVEGVPIARPVGRSFLGEALVTSRPTVSPDMSEAAFAAAKTQYLRGLRARVGGEIGEALTEAEDLALRAAWRGEETQRIMDPIFGKATQEARRSLPKDAAAKLAQQQKEMVGIFNDPSLDMVTRRKLLGEKLGDVRALAEGHPELRAAIDFGGLEARIQSASLEASSGMLVSDGAGNLTQNGKPAGTVHDLMDRLAKANNVNFENGIDIQYVIWKVPPRTPGGKSEVQILSRPVPKAEIPARLPPKLDPLAPNAGGRYVVDLGAGESGYAMDMTPAADRDKGLLVQTEVSEFPMLAQSRRDLSFGRAAPRQDPRSVTVFGDALGNLEEFFGRPSDGRGVRRLFINNVNANFKDADYKRLAEQLRKVMGRGGRVEIQWDMSPERPNLPQGSRNHVRGDLLNEALGGHGYKYEEGRGIAYDYSVTPTREKGATTAGKAGTLTPPDPSGKLGKRAVFTFD
jgi:hypothetical protein